MATASPDPFLSASAEWGRQLFQASDEIVLLHDEAGALLEANPAACRRLGYAREELLRHNIRDIHVPEPAVAYLPRHAERPSLARSRGEAVYRTRDGRNLAVEVRSCAVRYQERPAVLLIARDLSHHRQLEEALGKQGQLLQSILDSMDNAILVADSQHHIFLFNRLAERLLGPGLLQGSLQLYLPDRVTPLPDSPLAWCVRGESFDELEVFVRHAEAPQGLWLSMTGRPLCERDGEVKGGVLVCRDVTHRHHAERRLKAQYDVARVLAEGEGLETTIRQLLQILCEALDHDLGLLWRADPGKPALQMLAHWHRAGLALDEFLAQALARGMALGEDLPDLLWNQQEPERYLVDDSHWAAYERWTAARAAGLSHAVAFPVGTGSAATGMLVFWSRAEQPLDDALASMMQALGNQIGQFLEHQRVEKELRDSQALYQSLVQSLPQNIFRKDKGGRLTFANQRYCISLRRPL